MKFQILKKEAYSDSERKVSKTNVIMDDQIIWSRFKSGDEEAFVLLYKNYGNTLYGYGCRFSVDNELVKDCLQDFFVYLREKREGLGNPVSVKSYLLKAFKRRVLDYLKKVQKERKQKFIFDDFPIERFYETISLYKQEKTKLLNLEKALESLNSKEREAIYCFYYQNLSYEQIAEIFNYTHVSSARRIIYKALYKMKGCIKFSSLE